MDRNRDEVSRGLGRGACERQEREEKRSKITANTQCKMDDGIVSRQVISPFTTIDASERQKDSRWAEHPLATSVWRGPA